MILFLWNKNVLIPFFYFSVLMFACILYMTVKLCFCLMFRISPTLHRLEHPFLPVLRALACLLVLLGLELQEASPSLALNGM